MEKKSKEELEKSIKTLKREKIILVILLVLCIFPFNIIISRHESKDKSAEKELQELYTSCKNRKTKTEKDWYNYPIERYIGDSKKGSEVKQMIEEIISQNNQYVNTVGKFISVHNGSMDGDENSQIKAFKDSDKLDNTCFEANIYENPENGQNTQEKIDAATDQMRSFKQKISSGKKYKVESVKNEDDGILYAVYISPNPDESK